MEIPEYEAFDYTEVEAALKEVRRQYEAGEPTAWKGPDRLHFRVLATNPPPSWHFSAEGLSSHWEQGRDFWDVYTLVAFQLGFHNGVVRMEPDVAAARSHADSYRRMLEIARGEVS